MLLDSYYGFNQFVTYKSLMQVTNVKFQSHSSQNIKKKNPHVLAELLEVFKISSVQSVLKVVKY